jgi:hypothetical protein
MTYASRWLDEGTRPSGAFVQSHPDAFTAAKEVLQKEARSSTRGENRKATASVLPSEDD